MPTDNSAPPSETAGRTHADDPRSPRPAVGHRNITLGGDAISGSATAIPSQPTAWLHARAGDDTFSALGWARPLNEHERSLIGTTVKKCQEKFAATLNADAINAMVERVVNALPAGALNTAVIKTLVEREIAGSPASGSTTAGLPKALPNSELIRAVMNPPVYPDWESPAAVKSLPPIKPSLVSDAPHYLNDPTARTITKVEPAAAPLTRETDGQETAETEKPPTADAARTESKRLAEDGCPFIQTISRLKGCARQAELVRYLWNRTEREAELRVVAIEVFKAREANVAFRLRSVRRQLERTRESLEKKSCPLRIEISANSVRLEVVEVSH